MEVCTLSLISALPVAQSRGHLIEPIIEVRKMLSEPMSHEILESLELLGVIGLGGLDQKR